MHALTGLECAQVQHPLDAVEFEPESVTEQDQRAIRDALRSGLIDKAMQGLPKAIAVSR